MALGGTAHRRRDRVPARLPRRLQPRRHRAERQGRRRSTDRARTRSPTATSARRCAGSASASTATIACSIPAVRNGRQGRGPVQARDVGRGARAHRRAASSRRRATRGARGDPAATRYGGSNGLLTQDTNDAQLFRRFGASRLARTVCAAPTGAANMALYGKMPSVTYQDYPRREADRPLGREPVGVGHPPHAVSCARRRSAARTLVVIDPRTTPLARQADLHLAVQARHRRRRRAGDPPVPLRRTATPTRRSCARTPAAPTRCASAPSRGPSSARRRSPASTRPTLEQLAELYADELAGADPLRLGPRAQPQRRQRRDGGPGAAGGRRQVRRARRRLLDEQLGVVEHRAHVDRRAGAATRASST